MIAACPRCGARYRVERERLEAGGVRLRCARCEAVFRVRPPEPRAKAPAEAEAQRPAVPAPPVSPERPAARERPAAAAAPQRPAAAAPQRPAAAPQSRDVSISPDELDAPSPAPASGPLVLIAMPDQALASATAEVLVAEGLTVLRVADGVEAMLQIQRKLPRALVLSADLPKMFGFQVCEVVKRNESLRDTFVVLVGAIHHRERYRRAPGELYGADAYVEGPDLPAGLVPVLARGGLSGAAKCSAAGPAPVPTPSRPPAEARPTPRVSPAPVAPAPTAATPPVATKRSPAPAQGAKTQAGDGLDAERAKAERLARIVVSDIVLYNEERFSAAVRGGNVLDAMAGDLAEGRQLFEERIDARVRAERDYLRDELLRRAESRGAA